MDGSFYTIVRRSVWEI